MPSILPDYEYDIFISYRQNDNKRDKWVTQFVAALRDELEATLKNPVSIYFDENPHDGLLETHQVDTSLAKKLKCLIFIPIVSQTYCDTKSFAWEHEFLPFNKMAKEDVLGMNITLENGNVVSRVLPVQIHDIDAEDKQVMEKELDGIMRAIDFIYKEAGVNRPLRPHDNEEKNLNRTLYRNQINKVANALKEIGKALIQPAYREDSLKNQTNSTAPVIKLTNKPKLQRKGIFIGIVIVFTLVVSYLWYLKIDGKSSSEFLSETKMPAAKKAKSIAVLPFSNTKPDPDSDYLGFAIANQIIGQLDYNKNLTVRPSSAIRKYDQKLIDAGKVADDLKVNYVLTGNYLKVNKVIRLDIELIDAISNTGIWRDQMEVDFKNAFDLQDMVAQKVSERLDIQFSSTELNTMGTDVPANAIAYDYYLRSLSYPLSADGCLLAIDMLKKSIALDSTYAPVYVQFGGRNNRILSYGTLAQRQPNTPEFYYLKALSLNKNQLDALISLASRYTEIGRTNDAMTTIRKALVLNSNNAAAHFFLGYIYRYAGMIDESIEEMEHALLLYPANPNFRSLGITYMNAGKSEKALKAFALDKGSTWELGWQLPLYYGLHKYDKVIAAVEKIYELDPEGFWTFYAKSYRAAVEGNQADGIAAVRQIEASNMDNEGNIIDGEASFFNAFAYIINGSEEGALRCLKKAVDNGYFNYPYMLNEPAFTPLRDNDEFKAIMSKAKSKHDAFKKSFFNLI